MKKQTILNLMASGNWTTFPELFKKAVDLEENHTTIKVQLNQLFKKNLLERRPVDNQSLVKDGMSKKTICKLKYEYKVKQ